ncbi:MAG: Stage V sporulation protein E (Required for spore cortex synthesis) [Candidatus Roizmanbacteria bacterium GW2011_GWA2_34_18]|uniref:Probable peptidoglycan glycosyltransferase FtsW n=1 Tax=Candidatus Roizmanbacteria bacterium GW2011_GWA2_34_18 TaxID=1618477 RepID=A0A0G0DXL3_9BACT|nr:MAG: Stage V sporulation protein E (Required for spore cortex synthesis) [Candidatus Roizmanbacteria bacterium GW2011_GWA2_34_18]
MLKKLLVRNKFFLPLVTIPIILSFVGLIFIFEASAVNSSRQFGDSLHYLKSQVVWIFLGLIIMTIFSFIDYHRLHFISFISLIIAIILLVVVLIPGIGFKAGGSRRWIDFGFFNLQPTELAKFSIIIYLSSWFTNKEKKRFLPFITLIGFLVFLIILQPDMGTAIIIFLLSLTIYYFSGANLADFVVIFGGALVSFYFLIKTSPYRFNRLLAFFNPAIEPLGISYHINQIFISLSSGGLFGRGFGASRQKYLFLPEAHTDSIFAIIGEEYGFIGALVLISLYFVFIYKIYHLIRLAPDRLSKLVAIGIFAFFNIQFIINLAGIVGLFPITGVPLPFLSYGGSNLLISFALIGIMMNIEKRVKV